MISSIRKEEPMPQTEVEKKAVRRPVHLPVEFHREVAKLAVERDEFIQDLVIFALKKTFPSLEFSGKSN
jgi:hypothetical protein